MAHPPVPLLPALSVRRAFRWARRSPVAWWIAAAAVALFVAARVAALDDDAEARRRAWGDAVVVAVAARDLAAGDVVADGDVTLARWPAAVVPAGALDEPPTGRTISAPIVAGEAVVAARVAPHGVRGVAALVPEGHRAVAVPSAAGGLGSDLPPLAVGDRVDLLATFDVIDPGAAGDGTGSNADPTGVVVGDAVVIDVADTTVTVAVPEDDTPRVAFALARGTVTLALVGAG